MARLDIKQRRAGGDIQTHSTIVIKSKTAGWAAKLVMRSGLAGIFGYAVAEVRNPASVHSFRKLSTDGLETFKARRPRMNPAKQ